MSFLFRDRRQYRKHLVVLQCISCSFKLSSFWFSSRKTLGALLRVSQCFLQAETKQLYWLWLLKSGYVPLRRTFFFFLVAIFDFLKQLQSCLTKCHEVLIFSCKSPCPPPPAIFRFIQLRQEARGISFTVSTLDTLMNAALALFLKVSVGGSYIFRSKKSDLGCSVPWKWLYLPAPQTDDSVFNSGGSNWKNKQLWKFRPKARYSLHMANLCIVRCANTGDVCLH